MKKIELATLEKIDPKEIWKHEARDFTPWLAKDDNIQILFDEISITAENVETEQRLGRYFVDITAEESVTGRRIIVENQLEKTDHKHLGQLLTYASSFDACIIVWVVADATEEHKKAVDWFNDHMDNEISFFLVKVECYRIGNSKVAPKFNVIVEPNFWSKIIRDSKKTDKTITETQLRYLSYWNGLNEYAKDSKTTLRLSHKSNPQSWYAISTGSGLAHISLDLSIKQKKISAGIYIYDSQELFDFLKDHEREFNEKLGDDIEWYSPEDKKASRIQCIRDWDSSDQSREKEYYQWMLECSEFFFTLFQKIYQDFRN